VGDRSLSAAVLTDSAEPGRDTLYAVIKALGSSPDLDEVLAGIVDVLGDATNCHACFVYLRDGDRLRIRAASRVFAHVVGRVEFGIDEGLTGWVARNNRPAFIRENAMADPRTNFVPELDEEHFQSMVAVPVPARAGGVLGVLVLHTVAPREFDEGVLTFLVHVSTLVAGAIENARLYEEASRRVEALTSLSRLSREIAAVRGREDLYRVACRGLREMLGCERCQLHLREAGGRLELAASDPPGPAAVRGMATVSLSAGDEDLGVLGVAPGPLGEEREFLLDAVAGQLALALKKAELIERLTAENLVRDFFEALASGNADVAAARARAAGCDLDRPHVVIAAEAVGESPPPWPELAERVEAALRRVSPGAFCDSGRDRLRAVLPLSSDDEPAAVVGALNALAAVEGVAIGVSAVRRGGAEGSLALREAGDAARIARGLASSGGALAYADLGAYRYLVNVSPDEAPRDRYRDAVERLRSYDARRGAHLVDTLERYLESRTSIATTARVLFIHPNTLRQRLARIEKLAGLDLEHDDLLSLELAIKLGRLGRPARASA
jgi:GAF domain-containing protein